MPATPRSTGHGGPRPGAGRKPADPEVGNKEMIGPFRVAPDVAENVNAQPSGQRGRFVEQAVRHYIRFLNTIPMADDDPLE